jgi:uncharacterized linocin/CFP29 family protein
VTAHLFRELAPVSAAAWAEIESDARARLAAHLAARRLVDFEGPLGWDHAATNTGRVRAISGLSSGLVAAQRTPLPLVEVRVDFALSRRELDDVERGARDVDLSALDASAQQLAFAENEAVFHGYEAAGIIGISEASSHDTVVLETDVDRSPAAVARAVDVLRQSGIGGPYGLAIAPDLYTQIIETTEHGGYPLFDHLREILEGAVVWAPGVSGGLVLSQRGGDFVFECGQDIAIGYTAHDATTVDLYLEESFSFRVLEPDAAVALRSEA